MQKSFKETKPTLYVVSTPIGNLKDMTLRALEVLKEVDFILAEDTRKSGVLLHHFSIKKPMRSYHEFNKSEQENMILNALSEGKSIALISDAGTPGISDPGFEIIKKVSESGYHVVPVPGASAILAALVTSGLIIQPFTFIGFLPKKVGEMTELLSSYQGRKETLVIYESPNRIEKSMKTLYECLGNRKIAIARELTKTFETIIRTDLKEAQTMEHATKGEYVIVIEGTKEVPIVYHETLKDHVIRLILAGMDEKEAIKKVAKDRGLSKQEVYRAVKIDEDAFIEP